MKLLATLAALALSSSSLVSAWSCLSDDAAQEIVNKSILFLQHEDLDEAREVAYGLFAENITQYGDSINFLRGAPVSRPHFHIHQQESSTDQTLQLGTPVYENATAYIEGTLSAPGIPNVRLPSPPILPHATTETR